MPIVFPLGSSSPYSRTTTYAEFLTDLTRLIDGEDVSVSEVSGLTLEKIINLGERRIYREIRSRWNEVAFDTAVTNNYAPIPDDWEATSVIHFGKQALLPVAEGVVRDYFAQHGNGGGDCKYFAEAGDSFTFWPAVADGTEVQGRYFCRLPDLTEQTLPENSLFNQEPDLFLYGCLSQSAPFFGQLPSLPIWESRYVLIRDSINEAKNRAAYSAGRMQRRPSVRVMR